MAFTRRHDHRRRRHPGRSGGILCTLLVLTMPAIVRASALGTDAAVGPPPEDPKPNLQIMQEVIRDLSQAIVAASRIPASDTVSVLVAAGEEAWVVQGALVQTLRETGGHTVFLATDSAAGAKKYLFSVSGNHVAVRYDDMYRDGFLGSKKVRRTVSCRLACQVVNTATGEVLYSDSPSREVRDTVSVDDIARLEQGSAPAMRGEPPQDGFFDRALEPFIIIGATGVAVYLFFHVRS